MIEIVSYFYGKEGTVFKEKNVLQFFIIITGVIVIVFGGYIKDLNIMSGGVLIIWLGNMIFCFQDFQKRFLFLLFHVSFFTFLLGRIVISCFSEFNWWEEIQQGYENNCFALFAITLSLVSLFIGALCVEHFEKNRKYKTFDLSRFKIEFKKNLQASSLIVFLVSFVFYCFQEGEKLLYIWDKSYLKYYSGFQQQLPFWIYTIASFMKYSLCVYLATLPTKKRALVPLVLYVISNIPALIIGVRNPIVLSILFVLAYYVLRNVIDEKEKWFGRFEKVSMAICIPGGILFLAVYGYVRSNQTIKSYNPLKLFEDFFYSQGVTLNVLTRGYGHRFNLPQREFRNYTFGGIIDYVIHGRVGQILFGTEALPDGNHWLNGRVSNNLSHNLSYLLMEDNYLKGRGLGSSYILENYIDFGYVGVVLFSIILGGLLIWFVHGFGHNMLVNTIILVSLMQIFFIPRAEATGWLTFIVTIQFWFCVLCCYLGAWIIKKWGWLSSLLEKMLIKDNE